MDGRTDRYRGIMDRTLDRLIMIDRQIDIQLIVFVCSVSRFAHGSLITGWATSMLIDLLMVSFLWSTARRALKRQLGLGDKVN